jgi:hypothetical protein
MIFIADVIAGLPGIIVSDERYVGNWCLTTLEEARKYEDTGEGAGYGDAYDLHTKNFRWYGVDNSPLISKEIFYLITGLFRQAVRMHEESLEEGLFSIITRKEVNRAMETSDKELAWHLLQKVKHFLIGKSNSSYFLLGGNRWAALEYIYKSTKDLPVASLFGEDLISRWNLERAGSPYGYTDNHRGWMTFARKHSRGKTRGASRG